MAKYIIYGAGLLLIVGFGLYLELATDNLLDDSHAKAKQVVSVIHSENQK